MEGKELYFAFASNVSDRKMKQRGAKFTSRKSAVLRGYRFAQGPHSHILMTGGGGAKDFFGSDILAKRDFWGSMKDRRDFFGWRKQHRDFLGIVFFISSNQQ